MLYYTLSPTNLWASKTLETRRRSSALKGGVLLRHSLVLGSFNHVMNIAIPLYSDISYRCLILTVPGYLWLSLAILV